MESEPERFIEGELIEVRLTVRLPVAATAEQVEEWLEHEAGGGSIELNNPLISHGLEAWSPASLDWKGLGEIGIREECDHRPTPTGGTRYTVMYRRVPVPQEGA